MKQFSLLEIVSTVVLLAAVVADLLESSMLLTQAALQATHRRTPAPHGMLAALPTVTRIEEEEPAWQRVPQEE